VNSYDLTNYDVPNAPTTTFPSWSRFNYINGTTFHTTDFPISPDGGKTFIPEGNLGRNTYRGPGLAQQDLAIHKNTSLPWLFGEKANLQLRLEAFNAFNRVNPTTWTTGLASATFGKTTASFIARTLELTARITF
jgi:hypothetical protein